MVVAWRLLEEDPDFERGWSVRSRILGRASQDNQLLSFYLSEDATDKPNRFFVLHLELLVAGTS